uniref:ABC transporter domain-containing protein n=1 Tax=Macrostomum lignano TaxID=282301 RepID=A0A1I8GBH9_9PLAT
MASQEVEAEQDVTAHPGLNANGEGSRKRLTLIADRFCVFAGEKQILHDVSVIAKSGSLLAVMGPSGSGKTTFMNTVSGRMPLTSGSITVGGKPVSPRMRKSFGYVTQMDVFFPILTLRQTVEFAARVKLPDSMTEKERRARIDGVIRSLELEKCMETIIGNFMMPGLSGGEKKRANIACELLRNPDVLLLDEPTSGLDSSLAMTLIDLLRRWSIKENKIVIASIHQPSSQIFHVFDDLLLLTDGHISYSGKRSGMVDYFESIDVPFHKHWNPADFMLEIVKGSSENKHHIIEQGARFSDLGQLKSLITADSSRALLDQGAGGDGEDADEVNGYLEKQGNGSSVSLGHVNPAYEEADGKANGKADTHLEMSGPVPIEYVDDDGDERELSEVTRVKWCRQLNALTIRGFYLARSRFLSVFPIIQTLFVGLICSLLWWQITRTEEHISDIMGCIFFLTANLSFSPLFEAIMSFHEDIMIVKHERRAGMYQIGAYYVAKMATEMPLVIVMPFITLTLVYWIAGLGTGVEYVPFVLGILVNSIACQGIGIFIGLLTDIPKANMTIAFVFMMFSFLLGGFFTTAIPSWLVWAKYLSFIRYCYHLGLLLSMLSSPNFLCATTLRSAYPSCLNGTYLNANNQTTFPSSEIIQYLPDQPLPIWANCLVLLLFLVLFRVAGYLWLRYMKKV